MTGEGSDVGLAIGVAVRPGGFDRDLNELAAPIPAVDEAVVFQMPADAVVGKWCAVAGEDAAVLASCVLGDLAVGFADDARQLIAVLRRAFIAAPAGNRTSVGVMPTALVSVTATRATAPKLVTSVLTCESTRVDVVNGSAAGSAKLPEGRPLRLAKQIAADEVEHAIAEGPPPLHWHLSRHVELDDLAKAL